MGEKARYWKGRFEATKDEVRLLEGLLREAKQQLKRGGFPPDLTVHALEQARRARRAKDDLQKLYDDLLATRFPDTGYGKPQGPEYRL